MTKRKKNPICICCGGEGSGHMLHCWGLHFCNSCQEVIAKDYIIKILFR
jgi:hypothetical protein